MSASFTPYVSPDAPPFQKEPPLPWPKVPKRPRLPTPLDWMRDASCAGKAELFFSDEREDRDEARALCRRCPVKTECFAYAKRAKDQHGVWGGRYANSINRGEATRPLWADVGRSSAPAAEWPRPIGSEPSTPMRGRREPSASRQGAEPVCLLIAVAAMSTAMSRPAFPK